MAADRIRLTDTPPPRCSACFQAQPDVRHVDFGADYDGPIVPVHESEQLVGVKGVSIDELILCESCIRSAARLLGLVDPDAVLAERNLLQHGNEVLVAKLQARDGYIKALEAAVASKQEVVLVPEKPDLDVSPVDREPPEQLTPPAPVAVRRRRPRGRADA